MKKQPRQGCMLSQTYNTTFTVPEENIIREKQGDVKILKNMISRFGKYIRRKRF